MVMTVPGMAVLAEDMQEEIVISATQEEDAPDEGQVIPKTGQELTGDTDAYESIDSYESGSESIEEGEEQNN